MHSILTIQRYKVNPLILKKTPTEKLILKNLVKQVENINFMYKINNLREIKSIAV